MNESNFQPKASIILATYNWPEALAMVFSGLLTQTEKSFEVMLADDGSDDRTRAVVAEFQKRASFRIHHLWQENKGFRKSRILNQAILQAKGTALIFLDGDCVPHKEFVEQHLRLQDSTSYVAGRRVDLSENFTSALDARSVENGALNGETFSALFALWKPIHRGFHRFHLPIFVRDEFW